MDIVRLISAVLVILGVVGIASIVREILTGGVEDEIRQKSWTDEKGQDQASEGD